MGSPEGCPAPDGYTGDCTEELGRETDETLHYVELTYDFEMQKYELTQGEWSELMGSNPSYFGPNGDGEDCGEDCPIGRVNWYEALAYANALSEANGYEPCYLLSSCTGTLGEGCDTDSTGCSSGSYRCTVSLNNVNIPQECEGYRLPTEAEWEYAARAGSNTAFHPSENSNGTISSTGTDTLDPNLDKIAWYGGNNNSDSDTPKSVGQKEPNDFGLYDMSGNVFEWVWDLRQADYPTGSVDDPDIDPVGAVSSSYCIRRGGWWGDDARDCRSANRGYTGPSWRGYGTAFRLVRTITETVCNQCDPNALGEYPYCFLPNSAFCITSQCFGVPPSNQDSCYDNEALMSCPGEAGTETCGGVDFCGQDAQYPDKTRTYTCYEADGEVGDCSMMIPVAEDEVVTDSLTGLMWQRTYGSDRVWSTAVTYCENLDYGGYTDWRLPSPIELQSIVDDGTFNPAADTVAFRGTPSGYFWTSLAYPTGGVRYVSFGSGHNSYFGSTKSCLVRCVREGYDGSANGTFEQFVVSGPGEQVVTSMVTGLIWQKNTASSLSWEDALAYCENLEYADLTDWRLPNKKELLSLLNYEFLSPCSDFPDTPLGTFWSSSTYVGDVTKGWGIGFSSGDVYHWSKANLYKARCVRGVP